jgi:hypothetical protein
VIYGMTIAWGCDDCGHKNTESYGEEEGNSPTIKITPPHFNRTDQGELLCDECYARAPRPGWHKITLMRSSGKYAVSKLEPRLFPDANTDLSVRWPHLHRLVNPGGELDQKIVGSGWVGVWVKIGKDGHNDEPWPLELSLDPKAAKKESE